MRQKSILKVDELRIRHEDYPLLENVVVRGSAWLMEPRYPEAGLPTQADLSIRIPDLDLGKMVEINPSMCVENSYIFSRLDGRLMSADEIYRQKHPGYTHHREASDFTANETLHTRKGGKVKQYVSERIKPKDVDECYKRTRAFYEYCVNGDVKQDAEIWRNFIATMNEMRTWNPNEELIQKIVFNNDTFFLSRIGNNDKSIAPLKGLKDPRVVSTLWVMYHWANVNDSQGEYTKHAKNILAWIEHMLIVIRKSKYIFTKSFMTVLVPTQFTWEESDADYAALNGLMHQTYFWIPSDGYYKYGNVTLPIASKMPDSITRMCYSFGLDYTTICKDYHDFIDKDVVRMISECSIGHTSEQLLSMVYLGGEITDRSTVMKLVKSRVGYPWKDLLIRPNEHLIGDGTMFLGRSGSTLETLMGFEDDRTSQTLEGSQYIFRYQLCMADLVKFPKNFADVPMSLLKQHLAGGSTRFTKKTEKNKCDNETLNTENRPEFFVVHVPLHYKLNGSFVNISSFSTGDIQIPDWHVYASLWNLEFGNGAETDLVLPYQSKYKVVDLERNGQVGHMCYLPTPEEYQVYNGTSWEYVRPAGARLKGLCDEFKTKLFSGLIIH
jgi:hypothetical protein